MKYRFLWAGALAGVVIHVLGLAWDVYLHSNDPGLAEREGVFSLSNPGHALIIVGLALTAASVVGVATLWMNERNLGGPGRAAWTLRATSLPVLGLCVAVSLFVATRAEQDNHTNHDLAATHTATHTSPAASTTDASAPGEPAATTSDDAHGHAAAAETTAAQTTGAQTADAMSDANAEHSHNEIAISADQLVAAAGFYGSAKAASEKYEDIRVGLASGYIQVTQDLPGIAAHFVNFTYTTDGILIDPERPETLLYSKRVDGTWRLVGVMFSSEKVSDEAPAFFGQLDAWHRHSNLCFTPNFVSVQPNAASCKGVFQATTAWMLHVWTMPGSVGVFAHDFGPISPGGFPGASRPAAQDVAARLP